MSPARSPSPPRRRGTCPGVTDAMEAADGWLLRVRLPGGAITAEQLDVLAGVSGRCGSGVVEVTSRANLQIRGVPAARVGEAAEELIRHGLALADPDLDGRRCVIASPLTGHDPDEVLDVRPHVAAVVDALVAAETPGQWPAKFGVVIDSGGRLGVTGVAADVALGASRDAAGTTGWSVVVGGSLGDAPGRRFTARTLSGGPQHVAELVVAVALLCATHCCRAADLPNGELDATLDRLGASRQLHVTSGHAGDGHIVGVLPGAGSRWTVVAAALLGRLDVAKIGALAAAGTTAAGVRFTTRGVAALVGIDPRAVAGVVRVLTAAGWSVDPTDPAHGLTACIGSPGCASARADTLAAAVTLLRDRLPAAAHRRIHLSACEKLCGAPPSCDTVFTGTVLTGILIADTCGRFDLTVTGPTMAGE